MGAERGFGMEVRRIRTSPAPGPVAFHNRSAPIAPSFTVAVHVIEVGPALPADFDAEYAEQSVRAILSHAHRVASESCSQRIYLRVARAPNAAEAIVAEAKQLGAEAVVLGYHQPHGLADALLGSTVRYVARHAPCRVFVEIAPRATEEAKSRRQSEHAAMR